MVCSMANQPKTLIVVEGGRPLRFGKDRIEPSELPQITPDLLDFPAISW